MRRPKTHLETSMTYSKYKSVKVTVDGHVFHSKKEAKRYTELKLLEKAGEIGNLELQPSFKLSCGDRPILIKSSGYPNGRQATYRADFAYWCSKRDKRIIEDSKGYRTDIFKLKKAIVEAMHPAVEVLEV